MARIKHVKKAQQRYRTVPVLDDQGNPKVVPVTNKRTGEQKVNKRGRPTTMRVTTSDKSQPLPPYTCGHCRQPIEVGTPYKYVAVKSGPYGGTTYRRHEGCPTWRQSELTSSKMSGIYAAQEAWEDFLSGDYESVEDVQDALNTMAEDVRAVAEEYRESATNIEDGFGHATYMSEQLEEKADEIDGWADGIESADIPDLPDQCDDCNGTGEESCDQCNGSGTVEDDDGNDEDCDTCDGSGTVDCESCDGTGDPGDDALADWRDEVSQISEPNDCPV